MALQQHLSDASGAAEVAVNLERRVGVPQVGEGAVFQKRLVKLVGTVSVSGSRPEIEAVRHRPAGRLVSALVELSLIHILSQYGANYLAQQGNSFQEILEHYYSGVKICKLSDDKNK